MQSLANVMWALNFAHLQMSVSECYSPNSITLTLRQSPGQVPDKVADVSTNHESLRHKSCCRPSLFVSVTSPRTLLPTLSPTFPVHCNRLNSIRATQTGLSRTLLQTSRHVEMVCVRDIRDLCPRLSPQGSFGESQCNGIWTYFSYCRPSE